MQIKHKGQIYKVLYDKEDEEEINKYKWFIVNRSKKKNKLYVLTNIRNGKTSTPLYLHHFVAGKHEGLVVDHKNGNGLDNRKCNLRVCTHSQNSYNSRRDMSDNLYSKYRGVTFSKNSKKYVMQIKTDKKRITKLFTSEIKAAREYNKLAIKYHKEYAILNKI